MRETDEREDRMTKRARRAILAALLGFVTLSLLYGCSSPRDSSLIEISDYQGERLGSVFDLPDTSILGTQTIDADTYRLQIGGLVTQTASYTYAQLLALPHETKLVELQCVEGWRVKALWEGIPLARLFEDVGPTNEATTVIFTAADGYTTSLPLATILDRDLILADRVNGITLPPEQGFPLQLVAEDKYGYKWIRWITRIELSSDAEYRGYWESQGFSNSGEIGEWVDGPDRAE
jgi:DMSO/TMAO reductase YedYZ molybdopterin-dependent catalytic subunit